VSATNQRRAASAPACEARLAGGEQSAQRDIGPVRRPIRRSLFGGIPGRQACAAGWAGSRPLEWGAIGPSTMSSKKGLRPWAYMSPFWAIDRTAGPAPIM